MSRRTATVTIAAVLLVALGCVAFLLPVPYVTMRPGPTRDVLAMSEGEAVIDIEGRRTYETDGSLRLTTVSVTSPDQSIGIGEALEAWVAPEEAVVPRDAVYPPDESAEESEQQSTTEMAASQDVAAAAALRLLGEEVPEHVEVLDVAAGSPADGELQSGDVIVGVDGTELSTSTALVRAIRDREIGAGVQLTVRRDDAEHEVTLPTVSSEAQNPAPGEPYPVIGVSLRLSYELPFDVEINLPASIGGPSAGGVFAIGIYDALTPGSLTGGRAIAGTGEVRVDGAVLPVGGIQQKLVGADRAGADVFLVPADNCTGAASIDLDDEPRLVRVEELADAVESLEALAADPEADVPTCA